MSTYQVVFHPEAQTELTGLATSQDETKVLAAAQILNLLALVQVHAAIRDRLLATSQTIGVTDNGTYRQVDIKVIIGLKEIADDSKWHTDAIRRIRDLTNKPADNYRVFFVARSKKTGGTFFQVLGIFERDNAYSPATLAELRKRY